MTTYHSFVRIHTLLWADIFVALAFFVLQDYLTSVWGLSFTHAAAIINFWGGISRVLPVFFLFVADIVLRYFGLLVITSIAYSTGIGFVALSTPPILAGVTNTCRSFEPECVGHIQKGLLFSGLVLVAIGMAGNGVAVKPFLEEQKGNGGHGNISWKLFSYLLVTIVALAGAFGIPFIKPWSIRFGIPAIFTVFSTILFLTGWSTYYNDGPKGSPIVSVIKVFIAAACNARKSFPKPREEEDEPDRNAAFTRTRCLSCLHKAAIERNKWKWMQCDVKDVEEAKIVIRMIPIGLTFIVCGIVSSTGNTYFVEQAKTMDRRIGKLKLPPQVLLLIYFFAKEVCKIFIQKYLAPEDPNQERKQSKRKYAPSFGISFAMISSILCCIAAALVETKRQNVIRSHLLSDHHKITIPMTIFWLTFQFILLAGLDSFLEESVAAFYRDEAPISVTKYLKWFAMFVYGLGFMCNVLVVDVAGEVSKKFGNNRSWFQHTLHKSHLDRYFWVLAALSSVNLIVFTVIALSYRYSERRSQGNTERAAIADRTDIPNSIINS